ncbi:MAG: YidB family protein [Pseudorhodobacter sp.]
MSLLNNLASALTGGSASSGGMAQIAQIAMKNPQILKVAASMLAADNKHGGLAGLMAQFQQAGLGDVAQSWVGVGENKPVAPSQIEQAFGQTGLRRIAAKSGVSEAEAPGLLAQILPVLVDQMTPKGAPPEQAPPNADALLGMLGGLLGKR